VNAANPRAEVKALLLNGNLAAVLKQAA